MTILYFVTWKLDQQISYPCISRVLLEKSGEKPTRGWVQHRSFALETKGNAFSLCLHLWHVYVVLIPVVSHGFGFLRLLMHEDYSSLLWLFILSPSLLPPQYSLFLAKLLLDANYFALWNSWEGVTQPKGTWAVWIAAPALGKTIQNLQFHVAICGKMFNIHICLSTRLTASSDQVKKVLTNSFAGHTSGFDHWKYSAECQLSPQLYENWVAGSHFVRSLLGKDLLGFFGGGGGIFLFVCFLNLWLF